MTDTDKIEKALIDVLAPSVVEGNHRAQLKTNLLQTMQKKESKPMITWKRKLAYACCLLMLLAGVAWGVQKIYKTYIVRPQEIVGEEESGYWRIYGSSKYESDDPEFTRYQGKEQEREIQALSAEEKSELLRIEESDSGEKNYVYRFILASGEEVELKQNYPIDPEQERSHMEWRENASEPVLAGIYEDQDTGEKSYYSFYSSYSSKILDRTVVAVGGKTYPEGIEHWTEAHFLELQELIKQQMGELVEEEHLPKLFIYKYVLSDGSVVRFGFKTPEQKLVIDKVDW